MQSSVTSPQTTGGTAERTKFTTFWLWLVLVLNVVFGFVGLFTSFVGFSVDATSGLILLVSGVLSFVIAVGAFLLLQWKKLGFFLIAGSAAVNILVSFFNGTIVQALFGAVISLGIIYYLLQQPKENKAWDHLA